MIQTSRHGSGNGPQGPARFPLARVWLRLWLDIYCEISLERGDRLRRPWYPGLCTFPEFDSAQHVRRLLLR